MQEHSVFSGSNTRYVDAKAINKPGVLLGTTTGI